MLSEREIQNIANIINATGSAFIFPPQNADFRFRFFSPKQEGDFCTHACICALHSLIEEGKIQLKEPVTRITQENRAGVFPVDIYVKNETIQQILLSHNLPKFEKTDFKRAKIAQMLNISEEGIMDLPLEIGNTCMNYLIVPIVDLRTMQSIKPDYIKLAQFCKENKMGLQTFTLDTLRKESTIHNRTFCSVPGVYEDPVCGGGGGPMASYLVRHKLIPVKDEITVISEQGYNYGRPSEMIIKLEVDGEKIKSVKVGGRAVTVLEGDVVLHYRWQ